MNPEYQEWVRVERIRLDIALEHPPLEQWRKSGDECILDFDDYTKENKKRRGKRKW